MVVAGQDAEFSHERFEARYQGDLANEWGNLLARVLTMIGKFCDGRIPEPAKEGGGPSEAREAAGRVAEAFAGHLAEVQLHRIAQDAMEVFRASNKQVDLSRPAKLAKDPARAGDLRDALYTIAESVRFAASMLAPILPRRQPPPCRSSASPRSRSLRKALAWGGLCPGAEARRGEVLFPRIEPR